MTLGPGKGGSACGRASRWSSPAVSGVRRVRASDLTATIGLSVFVMQKLIAISSTVGVERAVIGGPVRTAGAGDVSAVEAGECACGKSAAALRTRELHRRRSGKFFKK